MPISAIWSGGQTGVDRAAFDVALETGIPIGGWIPHGRLAEDGRIPDRYTGLVETDSSDYAVRTERNVRDSDATLILCAGSMTGGTALTYQLTRQYPRPVLVIDLTGISFTDAIARTREWLPTLPPQTRLNIAGPRASESIGIYMSARSFLSALLSHSP